MTPVTLTVPLFPLGTVLFPGLILPLHIFEQRYRDLVDDLLASSEDSRHFGVVAIRAGHEVGVDGVRALHAVGCLAELTDVTSLPDGRFDVQTVGTRRFRLRGLEPDSGSAATTTGYLRGEVDVLEEPVGEDADVLAASVVDRFQGYLRRLNATATQIPTDPLVLSYSVAANVLLDLSDKQRLLESTDTAQRLRRELRLLAREDVLLDALRAVPATDLVRRAPGLN